MNLLTWVKICQNYIKIHEITSNYINIFTFEDKKVKLAKSNLSYWVKKEPKFPMRRAWNLYASCQFGANFEGLPGVQIEHGIARWKDLPVYFPTQLEFMNFVVICPSKNQISQHCFLCVQKGAERSFLGCFWPFWKPKTYQNLLAMGRHE